MPKRISLESDPKYPNLIHTIDEGLTNVSSGGFSFVLREFILKPFSLRVSNAERAEKIFLPTPVGSHANYSRTEGMESPEDWVYFLSATSNGYAWYNFQIKPLRNVLETVY